MRNITQDTQTQVGKHNYHKKAERVKESGRGDSAELSLDAHPVKTGVKDLGTSLQLNCHN